MMTANQLREKTEAELQQELLDLLREQFNLRMQRGTGQLARPHHLKVVRRNIARVKTIIAEKARAK